MNWRRIQQKLKEHGFNPGPVDGILGPLTRRAVRAFQKDRGLVVDGIVGPHTLRELSKTGDTYSVTPALPKPPWYELAESKMGLHERRDNGLLSRFLRSDGPTLGDPARLPWCGDFVETCIARTLPDEPLPSNPYLARNWRKFGFRLGAPSLGAVAVFWRGRRDGISGHVGFYAGEDATHIHVLGGNQRNSINVMRIGKNRLLGHYWPNTYPAPRSGVVKRAATGDVSTNEA